MYFQTRVKTEQIAASFLHILSILCNYSHTQLFAHSFLNVYISSSIWVQFKQYDKSYLKTLFHGLELES